MWKQRPYSCAPIVSALAAMTFGAPPLQAGGSPSMTPVEQNRSIGALVIVPPCGPPVTVGQSDEAVDFGPFDSEVNAERICDFAQGIAHASQQSEIGGALMSAAGATFSEAASAPTEVIHAISSSAFEVTFELDAMARFNLEGKLSSGGAAPVVLGYARVRLTIGDDTPVFEQLVEPGVDGSTRALEVAHSGLLDPGRYTLTADAATVIDSVIPPAGSGASSFDIGFSVTIPADFDGDGDVDGADLAIVLAAWGPCPAEGDCPADLNRDGVVDGADLAAVLTEWTG